MASLVTRKSGSRFVQFTDHAGERQTITLGTIAPREAGRIRDKISDLATARQSGIEPSPDTMLWLSRIGDDLHAKLVDKGLTDPRAKPMAVTVGELVTAYVVSRTDWKHRTKDNFDQMTRWLLKYFDRATDITSITAADAEEFRRWLEPKLSVNTVNRHVKRCKQLFSYATRKRLLAISPFHEVRGGTVGGSPDRQYFVTREEVEALLNACPDNEWKLLVALSRFGGLRIPSEAASLRWSDINWERNRIVVPVPKLEHLPGHETRVVPIFPELRKYLEAAFDEAEPGSEYVIVRHRDGRANLRTHLLRLIRKAGLKAWPKPWHAMRASRQTELAREFPLHVVCGWIGNSAAVAQEHYLTTTEQDFTRAVTVSTSTSAQLVAQQYGAESRRIDSQPESEPRELLGISAACESLQAKRHPRQESNLRPTD